MTAELVLWIILIAWAVGWVTCTPLLARLMVRDLEPGTLDGLDRFTVIWIGMLVAVAWPLMIPGAWFYRQVFGTARRQNDAHK